MVICPNCNHEFKPQGKKRTDEWKKSQRIANAWNYPQDILKKYQDGYAIVRLAREYKSDKRIIREVLKENGIKKFRGRKGIQAWNKGKKCLQLGGENHWCWKGGITPLMMKIRRCAKYKNWTKEIYKKDNWTCQKCNRRGGNLEAHHFPKEFQEIIKENKIETFEDSQNCKELWDINNGQTFCLKCHNKTKHSFKFKKL